MKAWPLLILLLSIPQASFAEIVAPRDSVTSYVTIRESGTTRSQKIGELAPGEFLAYAGSVPNWHKVRLVDGTIGFVSKRWSQVIEENSAHFDAGSFEVHFLDVGTGVSGQ